jgi:hypothetical protein
MIFQMRSPDGAERNPGLPRGVYAAPDFAVLNPGYARKSSLRTESIGGCSSSLYLIMAPPHQPLEISGYHFS